MYGRIYVNMVLIGLINLSIKKNNLVNITGVSITGSLKICGSICPYFLISLNANIINLIFNII